MQEIFVNFNLYKPNTCLFRTHFWSLGGSALTNFTVLAKLIQKNTYLAGFLYRFMVNNHSLVLVYDCFFVVENMHVPI